MILRVMFTECAQSQVFFFLRVTGSRLGGARKESFREAGLSRRAAPVLSDTASLYPVHSKIFSKCAKEEENFPKACNLYLCVQVILGGRRGWVLPLYGLPLVVQHKAISFFFCYKK